MTEQDGDPMTKPRPERPKPGSDREPAMPAFYGSTYSNSLPAQFRRIQRFPSRRTT
jgi:hypothetical protein